MYEKVNEHLEKRYKLTTYPLNIGIEVTNHCNLNCVMCNHDIMKRAKGFMPMDIYKKVIDETAKEQPGTRIWLDFYGEALLAGWKLYYMIDYAKKAGLTNVCINTNGTLMKPEYAEMLIDSGVDYISLDCDGFSKKVYESVRVNGDRDKFYSNVEYLLDYKRKKKSNTIVDIKVIELEQNKNEIQQIVDYWRERGAWTAVRRCSEWVDSQHRDSNDINMKENRIMCGHAMGTAAISWDGIVAGCAWDYDLEMACGDINKESLKDIWKRRNEIFLSIHKGHKWDELPDMCKHCYNWMNIGENRCDEMGNSIQRNYDLKGKMY